MVNVVIAGLPKALKLIRLLTFLKKIVFKCGKDLHVNYFKLTSDNNYRQISFSTTYNQALKAQRFLDGYSFLYADIPYPLQCWLENLDEDKIEYQHYPTNRRMEPQIEEYGEANYEPPRKSRRYSNSPVSLRSPSRSRSRSRARSRSPHYSSELKAIELKIELVKKQRILMEEETKLLLEKRKLEYLKNFGSNNFRSSNFGKLEKFEEISRCNDASEICNFLASEEPPKFKAKKLPGFIGPCKEITAQMKPLVHDHSGVNCDNASIFWNLLRSTVKKRLAIAVEGKGYMPTHTIVKIYRTKYPQTNDQNLIDELLNTINTSFWPNQRKVAQPATVTADSQTTGAENPPADAQEVDLTETTEHENEPSADANQLVDLDEYVDMENDFENWEDDENETSNIQDDVGESFDNGEQIAASDDANETNMAEESEPAATTESTLEDVDEAVLIADDADRFRGPENAEDEGDGGTCEERLEE